MFTQSAEFYDAIYSWKDYAAEAELACQMIERYKRAPEKTLLDLACGTGHHLQYLQADFQVAGLDLDAELLKVAQGRCPGVPLSQGDMVDFDLGQQFAVITCLFSSIGYVKTVARLNQTLQTIAAHLLPGGVALVEPWLMPDQFHAGHIGARFVDLPDLKIARINDSRVEDGISIMDFHYLIGTPDGIELFSERHELALFSHEQYRAAFEQAGLDTHFDGEGLDGRGLYIGAKG